MFPEQENVSDRYIFWKVSDLYPLYSHPMPSLEDYYNVSSLGLHFWVYYCTIGTDHSDGD